MSDDAETVASMRAQAQKFSDGVVPLMRLRRFHEARLLLDAFRELHARADLIEHPARAALKKEPDNAS